MRSRTVSRILPASIAAIALLCTLTVSALAQDFTPGTGATCSSGCVTTHHNDNARDGVNSNETSLTPPTSLALASCC